MRFQMNTAGVVATAMIVICGCARAQTVAETPSAAWTVAPALRSSTTDGGTDAAAPPASLQPAASATYSAWLTVPATTSQAPATAMNTKPAALREPRPVVAASAAKSASTAAVNSKPVAPREEQPVMAASLPAKPAAIAPSQHPQPLSADSGTVIRLPQSGSLEQSGMLIVDAQRP